MASYPLDFSDRTATSSSSSSTSSISSASAPSPSSGASSMSSSLILAPNGPSSGSSTSSPGRKAVSDGGVARIRKSRSPGLKTASNEKLMSKMTWDGYGQEILAEFEQFWRLGDFLDVTLICDDLTLRAHKIVLAACSHYFERILCESECKHPVISLNGFQGWQVEACLEFIYKGVVHLPIDQVIDVVAIAQELEIRGLSDYMDKLEAEIFKSSSMMRDESPSPLPVDMRNNNRVEKEPKRTTTTAGAGVGIIMRDSAAHEVREDEEEEEQEDGDNDEDDGPRSPKCLNLSMSAHLKERPQTAGVTGKTGTRLDALAALSSSNNSISNAILRQSPLRRKQARPRRRSGDFVAQDLRKVGESPPTDEKDHVIDYTVPPPPLPQVTNNNNNTSAHDNNNAGPPPKPAFHIAADNNQNHHPIPALFHHLHHPHHPMPHHLLHHPDLLPHRIQQSPSKNNHLDEGMSSSNCGISPPVSPPHFFFPKTSPPSPDDPHTCSTPPAFPPLPFTNGFGQPGPWPGLPLGPAPIFGRHRAQHSAPRGGPPRAWSNADLTEALHNVWNKKMTTSQASRIFGIPYNSLLMYVRGKYGKSLKLDLLKKGLDMALENKNNNKSKSPENMTPEFNPFAAGLFTDYPPHFPFASALSHILPPPGLDVKSELGKTEDLK